MKLKLAINHGPQSKAWQVLTPLKKYQHEQGLNTVWGLGAGNFNIVQESIRQNKHWIYTDMPYWNRYDPNNPNGVYHWRICIDNVHCNKVFELPNDRSKHIELKEWRHHGEYILVAPSSDTIHRYLGKTNWTDKTVAKLKTLTDIPIKIRNKPRKNGTSGPHVADIPLSEDLANAKYVITSCSMVGVEAVIEGIPTFCEPEAGCAPVANTDIFSLEPKFNDRQQWLNTLSYHQWTTSEIQSGQFESTFKDLYKDFL
jgi:hypothetical protein